VTRKQSPNEKVQQRGRLQRLDALEKPSCRPRLLQRLVSRPPAPSAKKCIKRPCTASNTVEGERRPYKGNDMATSQVSEVIQHLRRAVLLREGAGLTDGQLLEDFISRRDEAALAVLVRRHGPMVWGVCRRVLSNYHDAEDAFQATFLVLVRKASSIASRELLANWLYGVAHQTALNARGAAARRRARERQVTEMPEPAISEQDLWRDLQPLLDEVLSRLPHKYRVVIVLCDLGGKTRKEAARQLGVPEGTVSGWLARARAMLAKRLAQRGVVLSGGALAVLLAQTVASAGVPSSLVSSTIKAATLFAVGQAAATGAISVKVAALTQGVLRTVLLTKLKATTAALVIAGLLVSGLLVAALSGAPQSVLAQQPAGEKKTKPADKGAPAKTPDRLKVRMTFKGHGTGVYALAFSLDDKLLAAGSDDGSIKIWNTTTGKEVKTLAAHQEVVSLVFSPDGKSLASTSHSFKFPNKSEPAAVRLWDVATWEEKVKLKDNEGTFRRPTFSPDGKVLAASVGWNDEFGEDRIILWDTSTGKQLGMLKEEKGRNLRAMVFSPDGKTLLLGTRSQPGDDPIRLWNWAEQKANGSLKIDGECCDLRFTRDGKVLVTLNEHGEVTFWDYENWRERKTVKAGTAPGWAGRPRGLALSPDEKLVAIGYTTTGKADKYAGKVDLRDTESGELVATLALDTVVDNVAFSPRGGMLAAGCLKDAREESSGRAVWLQGKEGIVRIWNLQDPKK
jgi:RNA polymerase sigma factor (sigma-70 family)